MASRVKRIALKDGEVVSEAELRKDENRFDGPATAVDDLIEVRCRGRAFVTTFIGESWPARDHPAGMIIPLRVAEVGLVPTTP